MVRVSLHHLRKEILHPFKIGCHSDFTLSQIYLISTKLNYKEVLTISFVKFTMKYILIIYLFGIEEIYIFFYACPKLEILGRS